VLGPILFTMFVNDLPSIVSSPVYMFADDTKIFGVIRTGEDYSALYNMVQGDISSNFLNIIQD